MKKNVLLFIPLLIVGTSISLVSLSCCSSKNNQKEINKKLKKQYYDWYKSLSSDEWNKDSNNNFINYFVHLNSKPLLFMQILEDDSEMNLCINKKNLKTFL